MAPVTLSQTSRRASGPASWRHEARRGGRRTVQVIRYGARLADAHTRDLPVKSVGLSSGSADVPVLLQYDTRTFQTP